MRRFLASLVFAVNVLGQDIDPRTHDIFVVGGKTFESVIGKFRNDGAASILFYNSDQTSEGSGKLINGVYNEVATDLKGQVKIAACDCSKWSQFCSAQGVSETPTVMVYPPNPRPHFAFQGSLNHAKELMGTLTKLIPTKRTQILDAKKLSPFLSENVAVAKVVLYSDKPVPSTLFHALANSFADRMSFGFVPSTDENAIKKMKVSKFPTITVQKGNSKPETYTGKLKFSDLHEWLNIRSETFVKGGGFAEEYTIEESKPWLGQRFPEMMRASQHDVCFKHKAICIFLLTGSDLSDEEERILEKLADHFGTASGDRGPKFRWSWMNMQAEPDWKELFGVESVPSIAAFHSGKRPRFTALPSDQTATFPNAKEFVDRILGGDARFQSVKKNPQFADRLAKAPREEL